MPEEVKNIYHFCYNLQLNFMFVILKWPFCCAFYSVLLGLKFKYWHIIQIEKYSLQFVKDKSIFY